MRRLLIQSVFALGMVAASLIACGDDDTTPGGGTGTSSSSSSGGAATADTQAVVDNYAANVFQNYTDALDKAKDLQTAIKAFTDAPSETTHKAAKDAWIAARVPYGPSEAYRFYQGPIDSEADPEGPEGNINSWPLDENYIDYTVDSKDGKGSLIADNDFVISKATIQEANTSGGEANVSDGYHAIEFLLWGQDTDAQSLKTSGHRAFTDYTTADGAERRKQYLLAVTDLLVDDLQILVDAWKPDTDNYRKTFVADAKTGLEKALIGIGSLAKAELSGERMIVAYKNKGQEDEHSCFSDTTNADLQGNFFGIRNVYLGSYGSNTTGAGITKLVAAADPTLDAKFRTDLETAAAAFTEMQKEPFDFAIQSGDDEAPRKAVLDAIKAVQTLASDVEAVGAKLGLTLTLETSDATL